MRPFERPCCQLTESLIRNHPKVRQGSAIGESRLRIKTVVLLQAVVHQNVYNIVCVHVLCQLYIIFVPSVRPNMVTSSWEAALAADLIMV